ncbi:6451_t:CDS:2, partial [Racocetra persica]
SNFDTSTFSKKRTATEDDKIDTPGKFLNSQNQLIVKITEDMVSKKALDDLYTNIMQSDVVRKGNDE